MMQAKSTAVKQLTGGVAGLFKANKIHHIQGIFIYETMKIMYLFIYACCILRPRYNYRTKRSYGNEKRWFQRERTNETYSNCFRFGSDAFPWSGN